MSLFSRRKDKQVPKTPVVQDKALQNWLDSVGSIVGKYIFGGGNDRLVSAQELLDGGIAGTGNGGFLTTPPPNLTVPPKVSGLTANGAFAAIYVQWVNPVFSNYGYTELWRADVDDLGQAVLIASTAVESYVDNVDSVVTRYYWARAVSDSGVKGSFNSPNGTKGQTAYDPEYVKQLLTSTKWTADTSYAPFQVVLPTVDNGCQYICVDGGKSASVEPIWPTAVNAVVTDGGIEWRCVLATERLPLVVWTMPDGSPAVFIDVAYIKEASITSAKINSLIADKIETGNLIADVQLKNKLWYGFNLPNGDFYDSETQTTTSGKTGFYLGVNGNTGLPVLHLNTGVANESRQLYFDGTTLNIENVDLISSADGEFDDLAVDSLTGNRLYAVDLGFRNLFAVSDFVELDAQGRPVISGNTFDARNYFCWIYGCRRTVSYTTPANQAILVGNGVAGARPGIRMQSYTNYDVVPYNYADSNTKYRMKKKRIAFSIKITIPMMFHSPFHQMLLKVYIFDETMGFGANLITGVHRNDLMAGFSGPYLAKLDLTYDSPNQTHFTNSANQNLFAAVVTSTVESTAIGSGLGGAVYFHNTGHLVIDCVTDNETLDYSWFKRLKVGMEYMQGYDVHPDDDDDIESSAITLAFQLVDLPLELTAQSESPLALPDTTPPMFTQQQIDALRVMADAHNAPGS